MDKNKKNAAKPITKPPAPPAAKPEIKAKDNKLEKALRLSSDEILAQAVRDLLTRENV